MKRPSWWTLGMSAAVAVPLLITVASPSGAVPAGANKTFAVNAFSIGDSTDDLIPAPGTTAGVASVGDVVILNDQLTTTHKKQGSYSIIGYDSGTCTFTRVAPDGQPGGAHFNQTYEFCTATAVLPQGIISAQGVVEISGGTPDTAVLAISGGTGSYSGVGGTVRISFGVDFNTYAFSLE